MFENSFLNHHATLDRLNELHREAATTSLARAGRAERRRAAFEARLAALKAELAALERRDSYWQHRNLDRLERRGRHSLGW